MSLLLLFNQPVPASITTTDLGTLTVGTPYSLQLTATGDAPITWSATGLPDGLSLSSTGLLTGTPTTAGAYSATITATNAGGSDADVFAGTVGADIRGHARRRRVARRARIVEEPSSGPVQAIVLAPDVPAYFDPPTDRLAGFNTLADALEVRLTEIEHKRAAIARRRREEEEIVRFLLRVA